MNDKNSNDKRPSAGFNIGTSSILVTFVLLCLVTFAGLSFLSTNSDYHLSKQSAERTASYYDANRMAEIYLANIQSIMEQIDQSVSSEDEYYRTARSTFADNPRIQFSEDENGNDTLQYKVAISAGQELAVCLTLCYPENNDGNTFTITSWQTNVNNDYIKEIQSEVLTEGNGGLLTFSE